MAAPDISRHPCFNVKVKGECGRVHLPVAPKCNIMCNYCNRKYDCVAESRPGVTSAVLSPQEAVRYMGEVLEREPRITVVGIAGPGDPLANPEETLATIRLLREKYPQLLFCLSTNGLALPDHADELVELGVTHVTVTMNAVDPEIGQHFYRWVRDGKVVYSGKQAAQLILERQIEGIKKLKAKDMIVKVNTIITPGLNDHHVEEIARVASELGVDILNCMALKPVADTVFGEKAEPSKADMETVRAKAEQYLPQMRHCKRCRADAVGLLGMDRSAELSGCLSDCSDTKKPAGKPRPYVAVATLEGMLVNQHLGEALQFQIWGPSGEGFAMIEERLAPNAGGGPKRWYSLADTLSDCRAVLVSGIGDTPAAILQEEGVEPIEMVGLIEEGLKAVYVHGDFRHLKKRSPKACGSACKGDGGGCG